MSDHSSVHVLPLRVYLGIGTALLVFTGITVGVSYIQLGAWNIVVALLIASFKATLVALFFMHLLYDNKFYLLIFSLGLVFLTIFIGITMLDTLRRDDIYDFRAAPINKDAIIYEQIESTPEAATAGDSSDTQTETDTPPDH